ncbi:nickel pincer cofactor biosynthesis protein LarB [Beduini massiliensis]|uniref:nickel pincer cofactor biosynthesis protein LarB n=1 Tax=Beduini massiliensis TaxID=1585974 RepID=UPI00059AA204|nr:nickel pincer cofactor biosynthesis protein LarB [Beduini massiliensis]
MKVKEILEKVKKNELSIEEASELIDNPLDYATIDFNREKRTGVPEVIYGAGKTKEQIAGIIQNMLDHEVLNILVTRLDQIKYTYLKERYPDFVYDELAETFLLDQKPRPKNKGLIVVACAGTSDLPVAKEAAITAEYLGNDVELITDVGVAGIHRLFRRMDVIEKASVIIAIAGMEGALASVIGGLTDKPVIAVPTSVGYGANFNGLAALLAMLNSCASGISVVNIDNGFGAGFMAHTINNLGGKKE